MKKGIIFLGCLFLLAGCESSNEKLMKEYATDYYNTYMKNVTGLSEARITLENLKNVNKQEGKEKYDLKKLEKCSDESYVSLILVEGKNEIDTIETHLEC